MTTSHTDVSYDDALAQLKAWGSVIFHAESVADFLASYAMRITPRDITALQRRFLGPDRRITASKEEVLENLGHFYAFQVLFWAIEHADELDVFEFKKIFRPEGKEKDTLWMRVLWVRTPH